MIYWISIGTIYLFIFLYFDNVKKEIPDKYNYMMFGITLSLLTLYKNPLLYLFILMVGLGFLIWLLNKLKIVEGVNEIKSLMWLILGYGIISPFNLVIYIITLAFLGKIWHLIQAKLNIKASFYPVFISCFISTNILLGLYII